MEHLLEIGVFAGKAFLIVASALVVLVALIAAVARQKAEPKKLEIENLSQKFKTYKNQLGAATDPTNSFMKELKKSEKCEKKEQKKKRKGALSKGRMFVLVFEGDIKASQVNSLREEVSAILSTADPKSDRVCAVIESGGGMVHGYGLAAAQLQRIRDKKIPLTVCVDKVAASGGYMMACTSDKILCAPFAIVGSIGVVAQVPNLHKLLKKNDIDYEEMTAGEYKRTVSMLAEITPKGKEKFIDQLEETHVLFKDYVSRQRPTLDIGKVATGEYWYGYQASALGLIDEIQTSDDYLFEHSEDYDIYQIKLQAKKNLSEKIAEAMNLAFDKFIDKSSQTQRDSQLIQS